MSLADPCVLFVDDDEILLRLVIHAFRNEPYTVVASTCAEDAAIELELRSVDVIVSDEHMPGMRGTQLMARIHRDFPDITRILMTGNPTLDTALRAINEGHVFRVFSKPLNVIDLGICLREVLQAKRASEDVRDQHSFCPAASSASTIRSTS